MGPEETALSVTALAVSIANSLEDEELGLLASMLTQLADTLTTIVIQRERCSNKRNGDII